jgi:hypothetical protein
VILSNPVNAEIAVGQAWGTILNDDAAPWQPSISISNTSVTEGNSGVTTAEFTVSLDAPSASPVTFDFVTGGGSATEGVDFEPREALGVTLPAGQTSTVFIVNVYGDADFEGDEYFYAYIPNASGASIANSQALCTIVDDDIASAPALTISDAEIVEGDEGEQDIMFTVSLPAPAANSVVFGYYTYDGTAIGNFDYEGRSGGASISAGMTSTTIYIPVDGDVLQEGDEYFNVEIYGATNASIARAVAKGWIRDNADTDPLPKLNLYSNGDIYEGDGASSGTFWVEMAQPAATDVTFDIATSDGTATAPLDYTAKSAHVTIPAGTTWGGIFSVDVNGDTEAEADETFSVALTNVVGASLQHGTETVKIIDNDTPPLHISIADGSVVEGNDTNPKMAFTVSLDAPSASPVTFDVYMSQGTAWGGYDFEMTTIWNVTIPAGQTSTVVSAWVYADTQVESDETFQLELQNVVGATVADGVAQGTIVDDDASPQATLNIGPANVFEGNSGNRAMNFAVTLTQAMDHDVVFFASTGDDTAVAATGDFVSLGDQFTIPAGSTSKTVPVYVNGDATPEQDETFTLNITSISGALAGETVGIGTIIDDDTVPMLNIGNASVTEGNAGTKTMAFTVSLNSPAVSAVSFDIATSNGSATAGADYAALSLTNQQIPAGQSSKTFNVTINGDTALEGDEDFNVFVTNLVGASMENGTATGTILNDDAAAGGPTLSINDVSIAEGNSLVKSATFTVTLSQAQPGPVFVDVATANGTATAGSDYVAKTTAGVRIPAGSTSKTFVVSINGDTTAEADETFNVNLSNAVNATIADAQGVGTITNDDGGSTPSLSIGDVSIAEGNAGTKTATFTVSLSAAASGAVTYNIATSNGTATAGSDYVAASLNGESIAAGQTAKTFSVTINGDTAVESDETFNVSVSSVVGANVADGAAVGTISNDDGAVSPSLSIGDVSISEGNSGTKTATFTVSLSAAASSTVSFDVATANGSATAGSDYVALSLAGQQITAGQSSKTVSVTINGDTTVEGDETFNVTVSNVSGATVADGSAVGTITNDDSAGGPTLSINDVSISEGNSLTKTATFTVTKSAAQTAPVLVDVATANGTATAGSDYVAKTQAGLRIPIGSTSKTFAVTINGDTTSEPDETFTVNLSNASGAGVTIADGQGVGTISNDDAAATPTLSIADASDSEGNSGTKTLTFTVSLSPTAAGTVSYDIATSNGTATAGTDYVASTLAGQQITAGQGSKTFVVTINGDTTTESDETFNVTLSNVSGATLGDGSAVGTISNDDSSGGGGPTLTIADVAIAEGNSLTKTLTFSVKLSAAATGPVTYNIATADGTAVSTSDYTAKSLTGQSIPAGTTSKVFAVVIKGDRTVEPNETFFVNVTGVTGATVGDGQAIGTITNDDTATLTLARIDAKGLVDDIDDGNRQPQVAPSEYALLLADTANRLCRRAPNAGVIAVEGIEHPQVLADLADAANATCTAKPRYASVMAEGDSRGFLIELPAKDAVGISVLGKPEVDAVAKTTTLSILGAGHATPVKLVLADTTSKLQATPDDALVVFGAQAANGLVDLTARELSKVPTRTSPAKALPVERLLVSPSLLKAYAKPTIVQPVLPATEAPAQLLQLQ